MTGAEFYIGIDLGGSSVRGIAYRRNNRVLSNVYKFGFIKCGSVLEEVNKNLVQLIEQICKDNFEYRLSGIGIAFAPLFEREKGIVVKWPNNRKWDGFPILDYLANIYQVPIALEDDANAAALGEQLSGAGKEIADFIYITVSTGIGCGIISGGKLLVGEHGWAGEIGHVKVSKNSRISCNCGAKGCLQAIASGPAILERYVQIQKKNNVVGFTQYTLNDVAQKACEGDIFAKRVFYYAGAEIGRTLANLVMLLDSSLIIVGGGVTNAGEWIMRPVRAGVDAGLQGRRDIKVVQSSMHDINGLIGSLVKIDMMIHDTCTIEVKKW